MSYAWLFIWEDEGGLAEVTGDEQYAARRAKYWLDEGASTMQVIRLDRNTLETEEMTLTALAQQLDEEYRRNGQ